MLSRTNSGLCYTDEWLAPLPWYRTSQASFPLFWRGVASGTAQWHQQDLHLSADWQSGSSQNAGSPKKLQRFEERGEWCYTQWERISPFHVSTLWFDIAAEDERLCEHFAVHETCSQETISRLNPYTSLPLPSCACCTLGRALPVLVTIQEKIWAAQR